MCVIGLEQFSGLEYVQCSFACRTGCTLYSVPRILGAVAVPVVYSHGGRVVVMFWASGLNVLWGVQYCCGDCYEPVEFFTRVTTALCGLAE